MKPTIYLETTIPSRLTERPSRNLHVEYERQVTLLWWSRQRQEYELCVSQAVLVEARQGNAEAAARRLEALKNITFLRLSEEVIDLADDFLSPDLLPAKAVFDAIHIAVAAVHHMDYLMTWNCRHIANAHHHRKLQERCAERDYTCPVICTPDQLCGGYLSTLEEENEG